VSAQIAFFLYISLLLPLLLSSKIRDRKAERRRIETNYRLMLVQLDKLHDEKMAAMELLGKAALAEQLEEIEREYADVEKKVEQYQKDREKEIEG
jgi:hypothetical protein